MNRRFSWRKMGGVLLGLLLLSFAIDIVKTVLTLNQAAATPVGKGNPLAAILEPRTVANRPTLKVYGVRTQVLDDAIFYWNQVAEAQVMTYAGQAPKVPDHLTVTVQITNPGEGFDGVASGHVGVTPIEIKVRPEAAKDWTVIAHELGHALGLDDYNTGDYGYGVKDPAYDGIMSYEDVDAPDWSDDTRLLQAP